MSSHTEFFDVNKEAFKVIGSQIILTPRSDKTSLEIYDKNCRPLSAVHSCTNAVKQKAKFIRPKSAGFNGENSSRCKFIQSFISSNENTLPGKFSIAVSNFTNYSSKLLQNLLENSAREETYESKTLSQLSSDRQSEGKTEKKCSEDKILRSRSLNTDLKLQNKSQKSNNTFEENITKLNPTVQSKYTEVVDEKTVRFLEKHTSNFLDQNLCQEDCIYLKNHKKCYICSENVCQKTHICQKKEKIDRARDLELEFQMAGTNHKNESDLNSLSSGHQDKIFESGQKYEEKFYNMKESSFEKSSNENFDPIQKNSSEDLLSLQSLKVDLEVENKVIQKSQSSALGSSEEISSKHYEEYKKDTKLNYYNQESGITDPTYEEIVALLQTLDKEDSESMISDTIKDAAEAPPTLKDFTEEKTDYYFAISSYLKQLEMEDSSLHENCVKTEKWNSANVTSPRLEELLNKNSVELAHEVFSLKIQIEDQKRGIKLLKDTLSEMKEARKINEIEHQEALNKVTSETEAVVQRHQKFIKQLLKEKKNLNETVSKLVQDLKSEEERHKRNIKAVEEKHLVEIKRAKEAQAAADKIKREKWMENKTQKIKEMTVKGLEPEISRMASRQQEEMTELRNLHKAELEAIELRAARRNSELMDELRAELTKEKERAIAKETAALRSELEKEFQNEKNKLQNYIQTLKERIKREEERLSNQEWEFQQRLVDHKQEEEKKRQKIIRDYQEDLEELRRQHVVELKNLKESGEAEKEVSLNNLKKQQAAKFLERETELHQQYKRERDKEIELVIETLEKESAQIQSELNTANEGKLKRLRDKMEAEIKEIEESESALKLKLSEIKNNLSEKEDFITELKSQIRQLQTELAFFKKSCEEMSLEKAKLKEVIRGEFEGTINDLTKEKESLEKEIIILKELHFKELTKKDQLNLQAKHEMQKELTRVYSRIKAAVNKKEKIIESLREENAAVNQKCRQLKFMLDHQRKNLLLQ